MKRPDESRSKNASQPESASAASSSSGSREDKARKAQAARLATALRELPPDQWGKLLPAAEEIKQTRRRLTWLVSGCGLLVLIVILAALFIPYWEVQGRAEEAVTEFLNRLEAGERNRARQRLIGRFDPQSEAAFLDLSLRLVDSAASFERGSLTMNDGRAFVPVQIRGSRGAQDFEIDVKMSTERDGFVITRIRAVDEEGRPIEVDQPGPTGAQTRPSDS